jgi:Icc-related predicted phosphoesterase
VIRIAASADVHFGPDSAGTLQACLGELGAEADMLLLAGDLTKSGDPTEAEVLASELRSASVPVVAVLGNHDYHSDRQDEVRAILERVGVTVLEGEHVVVEVDGRAVGVAGAKGFGGGFTGSSGTEFGEPQMKAFIGHSRELASNLERALLEIRDTDVRLALMHYSPVRETLQGEAPEIFPFLGTYLLAEAVDRSGADLALHGHAHHGSEKGMTPGGVNVRNVAMPVLRQPYAVFSFDPSSRNGDRPRAVAHIDRGR